MPGEFSPDHPDPEWSDFNLASVPDEDFDKPDEAAAKVIKTTKVCGDYPPLFLGCATFSGIYSADEAFKSDLPLRVTRLALRYGINAFDTSPSYHPSEIILGKALQALRPEFPRESYKIITKAGKYGGEHADHMLTADGDLTRRCVERSLKRFNTTYLDTVYLHDVEYTASLVHTDGFHARALTDPKAAEEFGLAPGQEGKIWGEGDERILANIAGLRQLKKEGKIRNVGISAYPLPVLLRIAILVLHTAPYEPLDMIQSYSHQNLQNATLAEFLPHFRERAKVSVIANASPLNMGLLTSAGPPQWHGARVKPELISSVSKANEMVQKETADLKAGPKKIEDLAVSFGMRDLEGSEGEALPVVVGCGNLEQVHAAVRGYVAVKQPQDPQEDAKLKEVEQRVRAVIKESGWLEWSFSKPE